MTATTDAAAGVEKKGPRFNLAPLQKFGRSLMLPIAALPVAALLLRLGQADLLGADGLGWNKVAAVIGAAGNGIFANLPLLFAVGVAIGLAKKADGSTALLLGDRQLDERLLQQIKGRGAGAGDQERGRGER